MSERVIRRGLASLATMLFVTLSTSSALAAINFEWRVDGKKLEAGSSKTFTANADGKTGIIKGTIAGAATELLSDEGNVLSGANIKGGIPGTSLEQIVFENVTVDKPAKCEVSGKRVQTVPLTGEIVEGAAGGIGDGEIDVLVRPESTTNETYASVTFINKGTEECTIKGQTFNVIGLILGLALPQKAEAANGAGDAEANTKEYKNSKGEFKTAGLTFGGNPVTLTGLSLVSLTSGEKAGAF